MKWKWIEQLEFEAALRTLQWIKLMESLVGNGRTVQIAEDPRREASSSSGIRVLLISWHRLFSEAIAGLLRQCPGIRLEVKNEGESIVTELDPSRMDIVLIDASEGRKKSLELTWDLKETWPELKVVAVGVEREHDVVNFIEAGANGYVLGQASFCDMLEVIEVVHKGETQCSAQVAARVFSRIAELARELEGMNVEDGSLVLTRREKEVLELVAAGLSNKEIGAKLGIRLATVKNHVHNILDKLGVSRRREAIRLAYENGMLSGPSPWGSLLVGG